MAVMRGFSRVDKEGKIPIPSNIRREAQLQEGTTVEIKVQGVQAAQHIVVRRRAKGTAR